MQTLFHMLINVTYLIGYHIYYPCGMVDSDYCTAVINACIIGCNSHIWAATEQTTQMLVFSSRNQNIYNFILHQINAWSQSHIIFNLFGRAHYLQFFLFLFFYLGSTLCIMRMYISPHVAFPIMGHFQLLM